MATSLAHILKPMKAGTPINGRLGIMRKGHQRQGLPPPDEDGARQQYLAGGVAALDLTAVKDFIRFYISTCFPVLEGGLPNPTSTPDAICTVAEFLFAGLFRSTKSARPG
ncbi:hypothetical protein Z517_00610 [Fonsecaea pedrosoi CBS 271.37]|uniref:Uncharacterized protein n=1 Tax=Fonsecaea pedrosoi CBS 271.37 TaxID=1442368 RepID=A0A0D2H2Z6_9EURO|nr:uncharacterized protein Z517_00610 [Fonsecaea pedrosoi CBS 271.37]KIW85220.1 hypothetical protein Z517_00610 [Fonsecaea pedrosoi CBS 271.37]